ncbi:hypothetical protein CDD83_1556 [Cordyceps sp. RAO-2017]|nr:hypothetical protein CDD83_1556 [Cordyceps sp. RAO-2017]
MNLQNALLCGQGRVRRDSLQFRYMFVSHGLTAARSAWLRQIIRWGPPEVCVSLQLARLGWSGRGSGREARQPGHALSLLPTELAKTTPLPLHTLDSRIAPQILIRPTPFGPGRLDDSSPQLHPLTTLPGLASASTASG